MRPLHNRLYSAQENTHHTKMVSEFNVDIIREQTIAKEIVDGILNYCNYVEVAGGAPRDWFMGNTCNDIDIYFTKSKSTMTVSSFVKILESLFNIKVDTKHELGKFDEFYGKMTNLLRIYNFVYKGKCIQLIEIHDTLDIKYSFFNKCKSVIFDMDSSISQICWWDGRYTMSTAFLFGQKVRTIYPMTENAESSNHFKKMIERFPDYNHTNKKDFKVDIIKLAVGEI